MDLIRTVRLWTTKVYTDTVFVISGLQNQCEDINQFNALTPAL